MVDDCVRIFTNDSEIDFEITPVWAKEVGYRRAVSLSQPALLAKHGHTARWPVHILLSLTRVTYVILRNH
jgi:hypothetical protein